MCIYTYMCIYLFIISFLYRAGADAGARAEAAAQAAAREAAKLGLTAETWRSICDWKMEEKAWKVVESVG